MTVLLPFKGAPGTGKSTLARAVGARLGWPVIDKDDVKDVLDGRAPEAGRLAYDVMLRVARRQLLLGASVICDSPFLRLVYEKTSRIAVETGATMLVVECRCSDEARWRERIEARQALNLPAHHTTTWAMVEAWQARTPDATYPIAEPHLVVDTAADLVMSTEQVMTWLRAHGLD